jgi:hypothetical protein
MNVSVLMSLVAAAAKFGEAAQISAAAKAKLTGVCDALEPFQAMDVADFSDLLQQSRQYRDTGILPVTAGTGAKKAASKKAAKESPEEVAKRVELLVQQLNSLYEKVHEESVGFGAIDDICDAIGKLNAGDVKAIATGFGLRLTSKASKPVALGEIKRKLTEQKGSAQRVAPIGNP